MTTNIASLPDFVIDEGETVSNVLDGKFFFDAIGIWLYAPATFTEGGEIQVAPDINGTFRTFQMGDSVADSELPAAGKARVYLELAGAGAMRLVLDSGAAAGGRTFEANKFYSVDRIY